MSIALVWFRQDLRIQANPALLAACTNHKTIIPIYILDKNSLLGEAQAWWLHYSLESLSKSLQNRLGIRLVLRKGDPLEIITSLVKTISIDAIYWNRCYEPESIQRDKNIKARLKEINIQTHSFNGSLLNEPWEIKNKSGDFFKVFTPYWKACRQILNHKPLPEAPSFFKNQDVTNSLSSENLMQMNLLPKLNWAAQFSEFWTPGEDGAQQRLQQFIAQNLNGYKANRNIPQKQATSRLSAHLHFGEISPWSIVKSIEYASLDPNCDLASVEHFLSELGWREFSYYLLYHVPSLPSENFKPEFNSFPWHNNNSLLKLWQKGLTGYPVVDAGMRELWQTGYMHNRVRMIVASFLTKGLFIDWRLGAAWFFNTLVDADLANNSASWQWVAGCGADAAPYFRIFNPILQSQKFDPKGEYIRRWVAELTNLNNDDIHAPWQSQDAKNIYKTTNYPKPIIDHSAARVQALEYYKGLKA